MIAVGQTVGNYTITAKLGEGGMGVVYLAEHPVIGRKVAMKAIHPELSRNPEVVSRFMTEAKSVNQIGNEHIVDIIDFGNTPDGEFYFLMEFLQGEALSDRLKREHAFPGPRALKIAAQVADALASSHQHGIIHRDLKPENIYLIPRGQEIDFVKVLDFGLAKLTQGEEKVSHKTRTGSVMGTPYYMSPEQCEGKANVDHRADIYSLGVILFEMLTGKVPFGGDGYGEIIVKHITQAAPRMRAINPLITEAQEQIVRRALSKNRDDRFKDMSEMRAAMLDPDGYMAGDGAAHKSMMKARSMVGAAPGQESSDEGSGQVVFGGPLSTDSLGASKRAPMPTTFRENAGELVDGEGAPKSKKPLMFGVIGAVAVAGIAGFLVVNGGSHPTPEAPPHAAAAAPAPVAPPAPVVPTAVKVAFSSVPAGAVVIRADNHEELGTTPFEKDVAYGTSAVQFTFRKDGFTEQSLSMTPDKAGHLSAALTAVPAPAPAVAAETAKHSGGSHGHAHAKVSAPPPPPPPAFTAPKKPASNRPLDEDAVLEPSFK